MPRNNSSNEEIFKRLRGVENTLVKLCTTMENVDTNQTKLLEKHEDTLYGNGNAGLDKRVDRIEQVEIGRKWSMRALWGTTITVIGKLVYNVVGQ